MTKDDNKKLNACEIGSVVTLSDGRRIEKQAWPVGILRGQCAACAFLTDETCKPLKCVEDEGFAIFVEVPNV